MASSERIAAIERRWQQPPRIYLGPESLLSQAVSDIAALLSEIEQLERRQSPQPIGFRFEQQ